MVFIEGLFGSGKSTTAELLERELGADGRQVVSWYEFAEVIFDTLHLPTPRQKAVIADFPMDANRPTYSILENVWLKEQGLVSLPHWKDSLVAFLRGVFI